MEDTIAVIGIFGLIPFLTWVVIYFRGRAHARTTALVGRLIDRGDEITPDTIKALGIREHTPHGDLKTGMILMAIALAFIIFGWLIPDDEAFLALSGIAMFPLFVGTALILFWYMFGRKASKA